MKLNQSVKPGNRHDSERNALSEKGMPEPVKGQAEQTVDVLYQRLGKRWYAFSLIDDEVFVGSLEDEVLIRSRSKNGNS